MANIGELGIEIRADKGSLRKTSKNIKKELGTTRKDVEKDFDKGSKNISRSFKKIGGAIAGVFAVGQIIEFGKSIGRLDTSLRKIQSQTGKTGQELKDLQGSFKELNTYGFGTMEQNAELVSNLNKELGLTGKELTEVSIGIGGIASTFNKDFNETLRASTALVKNFGLNGSEANDLITKSLQTTGDSYDDILDSINEYSAIASDAQIPVKDFINVLLAGTKAGIRNTDELADVQREYAIRLRDGSKTSKQAFDKLGLSYDDFQGKITSGQTTIGESMRTIAKRIQAIEDPIIRNQIGTDLLGTKFEDNGEKILTVLANVEDLLGDTEGATDKLVKNSQTGVNEMKKEFAEYATELKTSLLPVLNLVIKTFGILVGVITKVGDAYNYLSDATETAEIKMEKLNKQANDLDQKFRNGEINALQYAEGMKEIEKEADTANKSVGTFGDGMNEFFNNILHPIEGTKRVIRKGTEQWNKDFGKTEKTIGLVEQQTLRLRKQLDLLNNGKITTEQYTKEVNKIREEIRNTEARISSFQDKFSKAFGYVSKISKGFTKNDIEKGINNGIKNLTGYLDDLTGGFKKSNNEATENKETLDDLNEQVKIHKEELQGVAIGSKRFEELQEKIGNTERKIEEATEITGGFNDEVKNTGSIARDNEDILDNTINNIEDKYIDWQGKIKDVNKAQEELSKDTEKYNQRIKDSIRDITKELQNNTEEYKKAVNEIQTQAEQDLASRSVEVEEELKRLKEDINNLEEDKEEKAKEIQKIKLEEGTTQEDINRLEEDSKKIKTQLIDFEKTKKSLLEEQKFIIQNTSEEQRKEAERKAGLSEAETIKEQAELEIEERQRAFKKEKERLTRLKEINEAFLNEKELSEKEFNNILDQEYFKQASKEEQRLIIELAREKMIQTQKKQAIINAEQEIYKIQVSLSNSATQIQLNNINTLKAEYQSLINSINSAIDRQRRLRAEQNSGSFASGGYTGAGGRNEVAGVVHKGEWVAPKWMVNSMKPLFDSLENNRTRGFADGGYTSNKTQNNNITVQNGMEIRGFLDYAKWKI